MARCDRPAILDYKCARKPYLRIRKMALIRSASGDAQKEGNSPYQSPIRVCWRGCSPHPHLHEWENRTLGGRPGGSGKQMLGVWGGHQGSQLIPDPTNRVEATVGTASLGTHLGAFVGAGPQCGWVANTIGSLPTTGFCLGWPSHATWPSLPGGRVDRTEGVWSAYPTALHFLRTNRTSQS